MHTLGELRPKHRFLSSIFNLSAVLKQNHIQIGSKLIPVAYTLKLNCENLLERVNFFRKTQKLQYAAKIQVFILEDYYVLNL
jgi:hypothetical protein